MRSLFREVNDMLHRRQFVWQDSSISISAFISVCPIATYELITLSSPVLVFWTVKTVAFLPLLCLPIDAKGKHAHSLQFFVCQECLMTDDMCYCTL